MICSYLYKKYTAISHRIVSQGELNEISIKHNKNILFNTFFSILLIAIKYTRCIVIASLLQQQVQIFDEKKTHYY